MTTIEITDAQIGRMSRANQRLHDAARLNGSRVDVDAAADGVITRINVLILPEHMVASYPEAIPPNREMR